MSDSVRPQRPQPTSLPRPWDSPGKNTGVGCHFLLQCMKVKVKSLSCVQLLATSWTAAYQATPSMGFSRQEYWSRVPLPSPPCQQARPMKWDPPYSLPLQECYAAFPLREHELVYNTNNLRFHAPLVSNQLLQWVLYKFALFPSSSFALFFSSWILFSLP